MLMSSRRCKAKVQWAPSHPKKTGERSLETDFSLGTPGTPRLFSVTEIWTTKILWYLPTPVEKKSDSITVLKRKVQPQKKTRSTNSGKLPSNLVFQKRPNCSHNQGSIGMARGGIRWFIRKCRKNSVGATKWLQSNIILTNIMDLLLPFTKSNCSNHRWCWTKGTNTWWNVVQQKVQWQDSIWKCGAMFVKNILWISEIIVPVSCKFLVILQIFFVENPWFFCKFLHSLEIILTWSWNHFRFSIGKRSTKTPSCYPLVSIAPAFYMLVSRYLSKKPTLYGRQEFVKGTITSTQYCSEWHQILKHIGVSKKKWDPSDGL